MAEMSRYEGLVTGTGPSGRTLVTIRPGQMGIPGAPEVSRRVCHTSTNGSTVTVDALNTIGAEMGDWVSIRQADGVAKRNLAVLLGIPLSGGISGMIVGALSNSVMTGFNPIAWWAAFGTVGLIAGIVVSRQVYGRSANLNPLAIQEVLQAADDVTAEFGNVRSRMEKAAAGCSDCTQCWADPISNSNK